MSTIVVGGAVVVVCVGGYYRYLRGSPSDEELKPMDEEVNQWQLKLPGIGTTLQMARLTMIGLSPASNPNLNPHPNSNPNPDPNPNPSQYTTMTWSTSSTQAR